MVSQPFNYYSMQHEGVEADNVDAQKQPGEVSQFVSHDNS
jgi:hypothetical protein